MCANINQCIYFGQDTSVQAAAQQLRIIYGDVNYDGKINNTDSIIVNRHIAAEKSKEIYQNIQTGF